MHQQPETGCEPDPVRQSNDDHADSDSDAVPKPQADSVR
jgi:hypothetical protein